MNLSKVPKQSSANSQDSRMSKMKNLANRRQFGKKELDMFGAPDFR